MVSILKHYWKSILVVIFIFYLTILHTAKSPEIFMFPHQDKILHFILFFSLSGLLFMDSSQIRPPIKKSLLIFTTVGLPILYGGSIEITQGLFLPFRTADWFDFFSNSIGSILAYLVYSFVSSKKNKVQS